MGIYFARAVTAWFAVCFVFGLSGGIGRMLSPAYASDVNLFIAAALFAAAYLLLTLLHLRTASDTIDRAALAAVTVACAMLVAYESRDAFVITGTAGASAIAIIYAERSLGAKLAAVKLPRKIWITGVVFAALMFALFTGGLTTLRYLTYSTPNYDFGIFVNMFYNMRTKLLPLVTCERDILLSHFAVHVSPIYYLILPFYALFPSPVTLQIAQAVVLASGVAPIFLLCRQKGLSDKYGFAFSLIYCLYPSLSGGCFYDIHENCFLAPLILWALYFFECRRFAGVYIFGALTLLIKEDAPVYVAFIALYMLLSGSDAAHSEEAAPENMFYRRNRCKIHGIILFAVSLAYFLSVAYYLNTYGQGVMAYRYSNYLAPGQRGLFDFVRNVIADPALVFGESFDTTEKIAFLLFMLAPLAFLPVMSAKPARFILLLPMLLVNLMTDYQYQYSIWFQYTFGSLAFSFYLAIVNASELGARVRHCVVLVSAAAASIMFCGTSLTKMYYVDKYFLEYDDNRKITAVLESIPADAPVKASTFFVAKLADRDEIYDIDTKHHTEYAVIDLRIDSPKNTSRYSLLISKGWTEIIREDGLVAVLAAPGTAAE
jgi:uncharacterized membrane protein